MENVQHILKNITNLLQVQCVLVEEWYNFGTSNVHNKKKTPKAKSSCESLYICFQAEVNTPGRVSWTGDDLIVINKTATGKVT